jgi:exosortase E/protease (VPEID-CTERM system)
MMWAFLAAYFWMFRRRLRISGALVLVPAATGCIWIANMIRIAVLVFIGGHFSPDIAVGGFHSYAGTILFAGISIATVVIAERSPFFSGRREGEAFLQRNPAAPLLIPFLAATAAKLITGAFSREGFDPLYPLAVLAAVAALWWYRREYLSLERRVSPMALAVGGIVAIVCVLLPATETSMQPSVGWLIVRCLGFIAVAPIIEELAFRGYLARRLTAADFEAVSMRNVTIPAMIGSSILFAAAHGSHWPAAAVAGIAYVWIARRTGRLADAICAHATTNAVLAAIAVATSRWWLLA